MVEFRAADGAVHELRFDWTIFSSHSATLGLLSDLDFQAQVAQGLDLEQWYVRQAKAILFAPEAVARAEKMAQRANPAPDQGLTSLMPDVLEARAVTVDGNDYGYVRIRTFSVSDADRFVREFIRLVEQLPHSGLIIDVRGNGGGLILAGEQLLQTLTPRQITPTLFQWRNTPLNRRLVERHQFLSEWRESMRLATQTGATYSRGFPITPIDKANEIGQIYHGPVVLITDALCYSTTDIFAAGFQDQEIGLVLGVDNNTGAGGANVWDHRLLRQLADGLESPFKELPSSVGMRVSIRRTLRVGKSYGMELEDLGVVPDVLYNMTRKDLLEGNLDLISEAARHLQDLPVYRLQVSWAGSSDAATIEVAVESQGIDRVDFYQADRPLGSINVSDGMTNASLETTDASSIELRGFSQNLLVARRVLSLDRP